MIFMLIYNEIIKQIIMPLLNFNTKQNIYIQVYIFVQVPCTILSELSKNASSNQSYLFGAFLACFFTTEYQHLSDFYWKWQISCLCSTLFSQLQHWKRTKNHKQNPNHKSNLQESASYAHIKSPISHAFKQEGGCRTTSAQLIFGGLFVSSLKPILP